MAGGLRIPTIEEVLELSFPTMIELKSYRDGDSHWPYEELVPRLLDALKATTPQQEIVLLSTNTEYQDELTGSRFKRINLLPNFAGYTLDSRGLLGIGVFYRDLNAALVGEAHSRSLKVFSWPPDRDEDIERAIRLGLDLLLSNDPVRAVAIAGKLEYGTSSPRHYPL